MRSIIKAFIISLLTSNMAYSALNNEINFKTKEKSQFDKILSNFTFQYFTMYTGRSLSDKYNSGATYNRFSGGTSSDGKRYDTTGSTQLYQSFTLGYKLPRNIKLSYGVTFQTNFTDNVKYKTLDGGTGTRGNGTSYNNHRIALWIPGILNGPKASFSTSVFYERPTNKVTRNGNNDPVYGGAKFDQLIETHVDEYDMEYQYGLGIQPTLSFNTGIRGLYSGITASYERYIYPDYTVTKSEYPYWCRKMGSACDTSKVSKYNQPQYNLQGTLANIGAYLNYSIANRVTLKSSVQFDYDQVGDQVGSFNDWGNNMDNIGSIGAAYFVRTGVNVEGGLNFSLEQAGLDKTAIFGALSLNI